MEQVGDHATSFTTSHRSTDLMVWRGVVWRSSHNRTVQSALRRREVKGARGFGGGELGSRSTRGEGERRTPDLGCSRLLGVFSNEGSRSRRVAVFAGDDSGNSRGRSAGQPCDGGLATEICPGHCSDHHVHRPRHARALGRSSESITPGPLGFLNDDVGFARCIFRRAAEENVATMSQSEGR